MKEINLSYEEIQEKISEAYKLIIELPDLNDIRPFFMMAACGRYLTLFFLSHEATPEKFNESLEQLKKDYKKQYESLCKPLN